MWEAEEIRPVALAALRAVREELPRLRDPVMDEVQRKLEDGAPVYAIRGFGLAPALRDFVRAAGIVSELKEGAPDELCLDFFDPGSAVSSAEEALRRLKEGVTFSEILSTLSGSYTSDVVSARISAVRDAVAAFEEAHGAAAAPRP